MTRVRARRVVPCILASAHCSGFRALRHAASQLGTYILSQCNCTNSSNTEMKYGELFSCQCSLGSVGWDACRTRAADPVCWDLGSIRRRMLHVLQLGASELSSVPHSGIEALVNTQPRPAFETASSWKLPFFFLHLLCKGPITLARWRPTHSKLEESRATDPASISTESHTCRTPVTTSRRGWKARWHLSLQNVNDLYLVNLNTLPITWSVEHQNPLGGKRGNHYSNTSAVVAVPYLTGLERGDLSSSTSM